MISIGVIESINGEKAMVGLTRHTACGECGACQMGKENLNRRVEALNPLGAKVGDRVTMEMEDQKVLKAAFIVYIIPLIVLIVGMILTNLALVYFHISDMVELYGFLVGLVGMGISFLIIKKREDKLTAQGEMMISIVKINEEDDTICLSKI
jgi:sigma-E factor negative regulatory protein RseC